jgi:hypothetical protein
LARSRLDCKHNLHYEITWTCDLPILLVTIRAAIVAEQRAR